MIYGFDYDGTLVKSWTPDPLPSVRERLAQLPAGAKTFIATNQAGPVFRAVLADPKYPTVEDVVQRITVGLAALDWRPDLLLLCCCAAKAGAEWWRAEAHIAHQFDHQLGVSLVRLACRTFIQAHYRKPSPGMLTAARWELGNTESVYIGDMETDQAAAAAAKFRYLDAAAWARSGLESTS